MPSIRGPMAAGHQRHGTGRLRHEHGVVRREVAAFEGDALAVEQPADDRERLLEPRYPTVHREPEDAVLRLDRAGAEAEDEATAGDLVDGRRHLRDQPRRVEGGARDERA